MILNICKEKFTNLSFFLSENTSEIVKSIKYLGIIISDDFSDDAEMNNMLRNIYGKCNQIIRKFYKCSDAVKNELFRIYAGNFYCLGLLAKFKNCSFKKLEVS